jgi:hypothetical protein
MNSTSSESTSREDFSAVQDEMETYLHFIKREDEARGAYQKAERMVGKTERVLAHVNMSRTEAGVRLAMVGLLNLSGARNAFAARIRCIRSMRDAVLKKVALCEFEKQMQEAQAVLPIDPTQQAFLEKRKNIYSLNTLAVQGYQLAAKKQIELYDMLSDAWSGKKQEGNPSR